MASQFESASGLNPFFWYLTRMGLEQHIRYNSTACLPNDALTVENDEI